MGAVIFNPQPSYQASIVRLVALGLASVVIYFLTLSAPYLFGFSAFPLVIAITYYKRPLTFSLIFACLIVVFSVLQVFENQWAYTLFPLYLVTCLVAVVVGEILLREIRPVKAILVTGFFLATLIFVGGGSLIQRNKGDVTELLKTSLMSIQDQVQKGSSVADIELKDRIQLMIDQADEIVTSTPAYIFISVFLGIWLNLYLILRSRKALQFLRNYPYQLRDLTRVQLPDWTSYLAVGILTFYVLPVETVGKDMQNWAKGAAYVLGTFFFLQGLGVYLEYLDFLKMRGFFRSLLIAVAVVLANTVLAGVGLFDMWFDFRRFFKNKRKEL